MGSGVLYVFVIYFGVILACKDTCFGGRCKKLMGWWQVTIGIWLLMIPMDSNDFTRREKSMTFHISISHTISRN